MTMLCFTGVLCWLWQLRVPQCLWSIQSSSGVLELSIPGTYTVWVKKIPPPRGYL